MNKFEFPVAVYGNIENIMMYYQKRGAEFSINMVIETVLI